VSPQRKADPEQQLSAEERTVLRDAIEGAIRDGQRMKGTLYNSGEMDAWHQACLALLKRVGPDWPSAFASAGHRASHMTTMFEGEGSALQKMHDRDLRIEARIPLLGKAQAELDLQVQLEAARRVSTLQTGSTLPPEDFAFVHHDGLRGIASRDYAELARVIRLPGSTKSQVVLAGAVVESILLDLLTSAGQQPDPSLLTVPLGELYRRALAAQRISGRHAKTIDALKDLRNIGHPGRELKDGELTTVDAEQAIPLMKAIIAERKAKP
jgi:hypothetical protein